MTELIVDEPVSGSLGSDGSAEDNPRGGIFAHLGRWTATHLRFVVVAWLAILIVFGAFAPKVETALAGAGWQDSSSQSVQARNIIQRDFAGLGAAGLQVVIVDRHGAIASDPAAQAAIAKASAMLKACVSCVCVCCVLRGTDCTAAPRRSFTQRRTCAQR